MGAAPGGGAHSAVEEKVLSSTGGQGSSGADDTIEVVVGRIGKPHGLRGDVTVDVRTDEPERRFAPGAVLRATPPQGSASTLTALTIETARWHSSTLLVTFAEIPDRGAAEAARGIVLSADVDAAETPEDPDEFYDHQLIGLPAYGEEGSHLGEVTSIVHGGAQDLLAIRTPDGRDTLVPFVKALVPEVDLSGRRIVVADRPGLVTPLPDEPSRDPA
jgi:16S rRNA processing protein RimM